MSNLVHGDNIKTKRKQKLSDKNSELLSIIEEKYEIWHKKNMSITGDTENDFKEKVNLLNEYKNFIENPKFKKEKGNNNGFTSQSKLHSTVIEEFMYYVFKDIPKLKNKEIFFGSTKAYSNLYFAPSDIEYFNKNTGITINEKDQDFSILKKVVLISKILNSDNQTEKEINVPIVSIECKTYLDKTMYEGAVATAKKLKTAIHILYL